MADRVDFSREGANLRRLADRKQSRLEALMDKNNHGQLTPREQRELQHLVRETQEITLHNARILATQRRRLDDA